MPPPQRRAAKPPPATRSTTTQQGDPAVAEPHSKVRDQQCSLLPCTLELGTENCMTFFSDDPSPAGTAVGAVGAVAMDAGSAM